MEEGQFKVLGGDLVIFQYLCNSKAAIGKQFMPEELSLKIKGVMGWYQAKLRVPCSKIFNYKLNPTVFAEKPKQEAFERWNNDV